MITIYMSIDKGIKLEYKYGELTTITIVSSDKVLYDGLKHYIELYEEDLGAKYFKKVEND